MGVLSGKQAYVVLDTCTMLEFESATITWGSELQRYNTRSGGGHQQVEDGVHAGSGTVTGFVDPNDPLLAQITTGAVVALVINHNSTGTHQWSGNVRIGQVTAGGNRDGTVQPISFEFMTHGAMTPPTT